MSLTLRYGELSHHKDIEKLGEILDQCFISFAGRGESYIHRMGVERCRIIRTGEEIIGGLAIIPLGQWWGNNCVEMGGIAVVGIAPAYRGQGAARVLMQESVKEMYARGMGISVLFPATQYFYRQIGYGEAGIVCQWEIKSSQIPLLPQILPFERVAVDELDLFTKLYSQQTRLYNGYVQRDRFLWGEKIRTEEDTVYAYVIGGREQPQGYIIYTQYSSGGENILRIRDWVLLNQDAITSFWAFLAKMRSQITKVRWSDAGITAIAYGLPEQHHQLHDAAKWMMRIVNVVKALEQRGYPPGLTAELHFQLKDDLIAENNGNFLLQINHGQAKVEKGGNGDLKLDIRTLAPIYTGLFAPVQLQFIGQLTGTGNAISTATQIFAGTVPTISDYF